MKKRLQMVIHQRAALNNTLAEIIGENNNEKYTISLADLETWVKVEKTRYPATYKDITCLEVGGHLHFYDNGQSVVTVTETDLTPREISSHEYSSTAH